MSKIIDGCFAAKKIFSSELIQKTEFHRSLGLMDMVFLGIAAIIGGGIFVLIGTVSNTCAGEWVPLSFVISGMVAILVALCYADLASVIPLSGGIYSYTSHVFGELPAWVTGGIFIFANGLSVIIISQGCSGYIQELLNINTIWYGIDVLAFCIIFFIGVLLSNSFSLSVAVNRLLVAIKLAMIVIFVLYGLPHIKALNFPSFINHDIFSFGEFGFSGILKGASMIFLAYTGIDSIGAAAQEAKNPIRDVPKGIMISLLICMVLYTLVSFTMVGVAYYSELNVVQPAAVILNKLNVPWLGLVVKVGIIFALLSMTLAVLYGLARLLFSLSKDGLLPAAFGKVDSEKKTPYFSTMFLSIALGAISCSVRFDKLMAIGNLAYITLLIIICLTLLVLHYRQKDLLVIQPGENFQRFNCPMKPWIPIISIILLGKMWVGLFLVETYVYASAIGGIVFLVLVYFLFRYPRIKTQQL